MADITPARKLFDLLVSRDFDPEMLDATGRPAEDPSQTEIFSFDFRAQSGKDYGTVVIMLGENNELEVYCSDNVGRNMEGPDKNDWFDFLAQLKNFATRNFMSFGIKNLNRLRYSMQGQAAIKEGLFESWAGKRDISWNAGPNESRLMIKHKRSLGEGEARFRCVESLFIETAEGERYKLPFRNLTAGKAMLEHVRAGGRPYDERGQHIAEMVTEINVLTRFRRANQGRLLEGDTAVLVEKTTAYYETLRHNLKSLSTRSGYTQYFENWNPSALTKESAVVDGLKHLFVTQSIDQRIEDALPLIARIQQQENAMKEANIFEAWAARLMEGTWQTPDTPEKQAKLVELLSTDLPVGADATNATEQLYDLIGDDVLFDQLQALADRDANADARQIVLDRMQELSNDPDVMKVITSLNIDDKYAMNPPEATEPVDSQPMNENVTLDEDGSTLAHITNTFKRDVKDFLENDQMSDELYDALYDYYHDDMPYGTKKARTGDPHEWVADRFSADMGVAGAGLRSPGVPDEDYSIERESDYMDEFKDPATQTEDPPETQQPEYPEYQADLSSILKHAGVTVAQEGKMKDIDVMRQDCKIMNDVQFIRAHGMTKGQFKEKYKDLLKDEANTGVTPADLDGVPATTAEPADRNPLVPGGQDNALLQDDAKCNMTEAGESCPVHGMNECGSSYSMPAMEEARDPVLTRFQQLAAIKCN